MEACPALVLNADFRPLSYYPLSLWSWQDAVKAVCSDKVSVLSTYEQVVHSTNLELLLPSVIALKGFVAAQKAPAFTRFNVFLRDRFSCQYCGQSSGQSGDQSGGQSGGQTYDQRLPALQLTFDHVIPRSRGGRTSWGNVVAACSACNLRKGCRLPAECHMLPRRAPAVPSPHQLQENGRAFPPNYLHSSWRDFLYWDTELEA